MAFFEDPNITFFHEPANLFEPPNVTEISKNQWHKESVTSASRIVCVLLLRAGFLLVQVGSIPIENVYIIVFRNIIEIATAIFSYGFIGFYISFGHQTLYGLINYDGFIGDKNADLNTATVGFCACLIGTAIASSLLVARLRQIPMLIITFFTSAFIQPILMCWCWSMSGWMSKFQLLERRVSVKDYGGNLVIHVSSACAGLIGALFLGRRILKVKEVDKFSLGNEYISGTVTGYIFIIIGHIGFNLPSELYQSQHNLKDCISHISINCLMAMGAGILVICLLQIITLKDVYKYWIIIKCLQGGIAGLVTIAAGIDIYSPPASFGVAAGGGLIFFVCSNLIHYSALEDCCSITSIYLICGSIGVLTPALFAGEENLGTSVAIISRLVHLLWQFICLIIIITFTAILYLPIFGIFKGAGILKNTFEEINHERAKIIHGRLPWRRYFDRIFMISENSKEISPESNRNAMSQIFTTP